MANPEHVAVLRQGADHWNLWRSRYPGMGPDLSDASLTGAKLCRADLSPATLSGIRTDLHGANLSGANLSRANFVEADLSGANLSGANLSKANFVEAMLHATSLDGAKLIEANLSEADLHGANLSRANLSEADLSMANLSRANLSRANLSGADVSRAIAGWTVFADVDLSVAKGLETIKHNGPSTIGIDTIYRSGGKIPGDFLRGTGLPENFIAYMGSLVGKPIEFYSCFISYSTRDQEFADRLYADLQSKGVRCWFAPHDIAGGKKIHEQIDEAIRLHDRVLLILSRASMRSEWVNTEIGTARRREKKEKRRVLFPVALVSFKALKEWKAFDADIGKDSAREVREYFIPDFSLWKDDHDAYKREFDRLLRDLKAEPQKP